MKVRAGDYLFRIEDHRHRDGAAGVIAYRRRVLAVERERVELDGVQRAVIRNGEPPCWEATGGLLGRGAWLKWDRVQASGYSTNAPRELQP